MTKEFAEWNKAGNYTPSEQITWLLNALGTMAAKEVFSQRVRNDLHAVIKQQQAQLNKTPVDNASTRKPGEFRVGDRVRRINSANTELVPVGSIGTVLCLENTGYASVKVNWDHCPSQDDFQGIRNFPRNLEVIATNNTVREQLDILQDEIKYLREWNKRASEALDSERKTSKAADDRADGFQRRLLQIHNFCQGY